MGEKEVAAAAKAEPQALGRLSVERDRLAREPAGDRSPPLLAHPAGLHAGSPRADPAPLVDGDARAAPAQLTGHCEPDDACTNHGDLERARDHVEQL